MRAAHWGGPVRGIDTSRATPYIVLFEKEKQAMLKELKNKISESELDTLFAFMRDREIVHIEFR